MVRVATRGLVPWRRVNEELERVIAGTEVLHRGALERHDAGPEVGRAPGRRTLDLVIAAPVARHAAPG
jgi:hypothetical protein